ncbi:MAG TPA: type II toxin-antitoxin system VapC family toxin [Candidatus Dormibacteraeota bacterium]|nr:type II toxin-antitoxin system VapC family toxin [Candidatus Dormibacteraeota bacterium]
MPRGRSRKTAAPEAAGSVVYWDASAVLSVLIQDAHSQRAIRAARRSGVHLLSTLGYAEVMAVIARLERDRELPTALAESARDLVRVGPWRRLALQPDWKCIDELARQWPLRGADLWHLATASTLRRELPELQLITFDSRLAAASQDLGLAFGD